MDKPSIPSDGPSQPANTLPSTAAQPGNNTPSRIALPSASAASAAVVPVSNGIPNAASASKPSSAANSTPNPSRDGSPSRLIRKATSSSRLAGNRPRKNSHQDVSPTRPSRSQIPTHTAAARSLSTSATPSLPPAAKEPHQPATPQKNGVTLSDSRQNPRWPLSPRLRSPPPSLNRSGRSSPRPEPDLPAINVLQASPAIKPVDNYPPADNDIDIDESNYSSGVHTPVRTGLETVQEVTTPVAGRGLLEHVKEKLVAPDPQSDGALSDGGRTLRARSNQAPDNLAEGAGRVDIRRTTSVPPPPVVRQSSSLSMKQGKAKTEGSTQNMTVETETVASIPQVPINTSSKADGPNGTLKTKHSTETIKPKKEKKKTVRKQSNVHTGTSASKADNFEAKIASAVDEANTSDSEETFVYDSNPPDGTDRTVRRFHSRTPSATSMASQPPDRQNVRSIYGVMEAAGHHGPVPKKSMKFVNTFNGSGTESLTPGEDDGKATGRSAGGSGRGTARHHHHIGRWGRQPNNSHLSIFDNDSPFANTTRAKPPTSASRNSSGPTSPRNHHSPRGQLSSKRSALQMSSIYDMDENTGADDERTPLIGTARYRSGRNRRGPHNLRQAESQTYTRRSSYLNRFAACLVLTMMFLLVITGAIGFMFATSQPMAGIEIVSIQNVVTSEQVLIFDLSVKAHNPNIVLVTVDHTDLEIFAKSDHGGTDSDWWKKPGPGEEIQPQASLGKKPPKDKDDDDEDADKRPNILLGRITEFDSPLMFEGSLFHQGSSTSTGEMKLQSPGNGTAGGVKRWDQIYQNEFDLIIKGVLKYTLPLSARVRSATVSGRTTVKPNSANDPSLQPPKSNSTVLGTPNKLTTRLKTTWTG
ncbi:phospholipid metabolism enzyme [Cordyceps militaris]|uniref:Phospholipid metabolism enzyme n=1 Tax=Cordyceps militaris TaxID=73501 RepID=A0A2H4SSQ8_CORMI|nr:phospholipid metabolism enzyme [Cordyceps militaris]